MPEAIRLKFEEYEYLVNNQVFSLLDQIENQIGIASFTVIFDDGRKFYLDDLQIFPSSKMISFKISKQLLPD